MGWFNIVIPDDIEKFEFRSNTMKEYQYKRIQSSYRQLLDNLCLRLERLEKEVK